MFKFNSICVPELLRISPSNILQQSGSVLDLDFPRDPNIEFLHWAIWLLRVLFSEKAQASLASNPKHEETETEVRIVSVRGGSGFRL